jgi:putative transcriptional regulator
MDNNLFDDLVASIKEAGAIKRKEVKASRVTENCLILKKYVKKPA